MLNALFSLIGIIPSALNSVNKITDAIANERLKKIQAKTDEDRLASEERVKTLEAQRDALISESNRSKAPIYVQSAVGLCVAILTAKLLVWDKVIGSLYGCAGIYGANADCAWFRTDPLGDDLRWVAMTVIGFYFLSSTASILKK